MKLARSEVGEALEAAIKSHDLTLAQVWIPYQNWMAGMLLGKLSSKCLDKSDSMLRFYYDLLYLRFKNGPGLVERTLETRQPHLCRNIYKCTDNIGLMAILSANAKSACFVICLRSSHTGELNHMFEFFWPQQRNHFALMEALLLTLKQHLPSFRYENGAQLGEQLLVVDVDRSSSTADTYDLCNENQMMWQFRKGFEEANKFLPSVNQFLSSSNVGQHRLSLAGSKTRKSHADDVTELEKEERNVQVSGFFQIVNHWWV